MINSGSRLTTSHSQSWQYLHDTRVFETYKVCTQATWCLDQLFDEILWKADFCFNMLKICDGSSQCLFNSMKSSHDGVSELGLWGDLTLYPHIEFSLPQSCCYCGGEDLTSLSNEACKFPPPQLQAVSGGQAVAEQLHSAFPRLCPQSKLGLSSFFVTKLQLLCNV